jgi:hypothetical protein
MTDGRHAITEDLSLALHRAVAERLTEDTTVLERARARVAEWLRDGTVSRSYAEAWQAILAQPAGAVALFLVDRGERARQLRQTSPFAGSLEPRTRWTIWRSARAARLPR